MLCLLLYNLQCEVCGKAKVKCQLQGVGKEITERPRVSGYPVREPVSVKLDIEHRVSPGCSRMMGLARLGV